MGVIVKGGQKPSDPRIEKLFFPLKFEGSEGRKLEKSASEHR